MMSVRTQYEGLQQMAAVLARVVALVAALWNLGLSLFARTTISLFAIPCWLLFG